MPIMDTTLFSMLNDRMNWLTQRNRVIGQNIANSDTPNYQAHDLRPLSFRESLRELNEPMRLAQTNGAHVAASEVSNDFKVRTNRGPYEVTPDGNGVVLEEQMMKMNQNQGDYALTLRIFQKYTQMYKTVMGGGSGGQ